MLQNAYFFAKIGADTAENEQHFAENLPKIGNYPSAIKTRRATKISAVARGADRVGMLGCPATAATAASMDSRTRGPLEGGRR